MIFTNSPPRFVRSSSSALLPLLEYQKECTACIQAYKQVWLNIIYVTHIDHLWRICRHTKPAAQEHWPIHHSILPHHTESLSSHAARCQTKSNMTSMWWELTSVNLKINYWIRHNSSGAAVRHCSCCWRIKTDVQHESRHISDYRRIYLAHIDHL